MVTCSARVMDFEAVIKEATDFVNNTSNDFSITTVDHKNSQIHLASQDKNYTFYVSCPNADNTSWNVWSDSEKSQQALQYVMDSCDMDASKTITALLRTVSKHLKLASGQAPGSKKSKTNKGQDAEDGEDGNDDDDNAGEEDDDNEEDEDDNYYTEEDYDAGADQETNTEKEEEENLAANFFKSRGSEVAVKRLVKDLKSFSSESSKFGILAAPNGNNLFVWTVKLIDIPTDTRLGRDLMEYAKRYKVEPIITLDMQFPTDYPYNPPFIRVVKPRFQFLTGHVTVGGSICMQMLTKSGWRPTNDIESILVQVRAEILSDPKASLDLSKPNREYTESEARDAFHRMVQKYGW